MLKNSANGDLAHIQNEDESSLNQIIDLRSKKTSISGKGNQDTMLRPVGYLNDKANRPKSKRQFQQQYPTKSNLSSFRPTENSDQSPAIHSPASPKPTSSNMSRR